MKTDDLFSVKGQVAVVTGAASGLGLAFTEALAENGATVVMIDRNAAALDTELTRLQDLGWRVEGVPLDVTDRPGVDRAFDDVMARHGKIDTVFANAGIDPGPGYVTPDRSRRPPEHALENYERALGQGHRHQPQRRLHHAEGGGPAHEGAPARADHHHHFDRRHRGRRRHWRGLHGGPSPPVPGGRASSRRRCW